jgi:hypothetical protein
MPPILENGRPNQTITTSMPPICLNGWTYNIIARYRHATHALKWPTDKSITASMPPHTPKWMNLYHSCTRRPCHPYAKINEAIRTSLPPCHPYIKMDLLISFLYSTAMPPIREIRGPNQNITVSMPPHTPKCLDLYHSCTRLPFHPYTKMYGPVSTSLPPCHPYAKSGWIYPTLARDHHATNTPNWTKQSEHHYLHANQTSKWTDQSVHYLHATPHAKMNLYHSCRRQPCHPYAKMDRPIRSLPPCHPIRQNEIIPFLHATAMSPIRQNVRTKQHNYFHATHTPKWLALCHSCTRSPCHPYAKME